MSDSLPNKRPPDTLSRCREPVSLSLQRAFPVPEGGSFSHLLDEIDRVHRQPQRQ